MKDIRITVKIASNGSAATYCEDVMDVRGHEVTFLHNGAILYGNSTLPKDIFDAFVSIYNEAVSQEAVLNAHTENHT